MRCTIQTEGGSIELTKQDDHVNMGVVATYKNDEGDERITFSSLMFDADGAIAFGRALKVFGELLKGV
jgi:hypothetical protein